MKPVHLPEIGRRTFYCTALLLLVVMIGACHRSQRTTLTLSAAASLQNAVGEIEATYRQRHQNIDFRNNFGSSGMLAQEIEQGSPADIFLSAATRPMDDLEKSGLIASGTRRNLCGNSLVLIAPRDSLLRDFQGLSNRTVRLIALGDPASVPAGQYGRETLTVLKLFDVVKKKLVLAKDVRQVLTYVETGNADAGIVYATDAQASGKVRMVETAAENTHEPILYPAAVVRSSRSGTSAREFLEFCGGPEAKAILAKYGFTIASS